MLADEIKKGFPKSVAVPNDLQALCTFADANDGDVSGLFEIATDGAELAGYWFDGDAVAAAQFAVFGRGPDDSLYAFWLHGSKDASKASVVLLESECSDPKVIADDFREFIRLFAIGYQEPGRYPSLEPDDTDNAVELRKWLKKLSIWSLRQPVTNWSRTLSRVNQTWERGSKIGGSDTSAVDRLPLSAHQLGTSLRLTRRFI